MDSFRAERDVFAAIADPTRRELLHLLAEVDELPLHAMTTRFHMGRTAVSKHLGVLRDAGLVTGRTVGRETRYRLNPKPLRQIQDWVSFYEKFWATKLVALNQLLEEEPRMGKSVSLDFEFKSAIHRVWFALTDSATLAKWTLFKSNDFKPVVGHRFQFQSEPYGEWDGVVHCEVLEVDAPHRLSYTWVSAGEHNTITWTLSEGGPGMTHLHLDQTGISRDEAAEGARYGWQGMAGKLEQLLAEPSA